MHLVAAAGNNRITMAASNMPPGELPDNVHTYKIAPNEPLFGSVTKVGSFDVAVFFIARGEHADKTEGGVSSFQSMLEYCEESDVGQIILVSSGEVFSGLYENAAISEITPAEPKGSQGLQIKAAEDICYHYWQSAKKKITVVRLPYIYQRKDAVNGDGLMANLFKAVTEGLGKFELPGTPETRCDFLSDLEAARLIWLIIDEGISSESFFVNAGTGNPSAMGDIAGLIGRYFPELVIKYSGDTSDVPPPMRTKVAKSQYGWSALNKLTDDFDEIAGTITAAPVRRFAWVGKAVSSVRNFLNSYKGFIIVEFAVATAILQFLTSALRGFSFAYWIDIRLLFVVILSTIHGTIPGIVAGAIAGVMLFFTMGGTDWRMIVYNPENWIPFALYVIMGVAMGSRADRQKDTLASIENRLELSERTNVYVIDLYSEAVRIKDNYRDQILGYKDNFGRIYSIVKKLNAEMSEYVFSSAIEVLEDALENKTVAIYSISTRGDYARMTVCSKSFSGEPARSMRLHDYRQIMDMVERHDVWFNRDLVPNLPSYCAPVYNDEKLIALVMLWRAEVDQMTLHYSNLFTILTGLIQESLVRAVKFNKLREGTSFFPDTRILLKQPFIEAFNANLALAEQEKAEFGLITVKRKGSDLAAQNGQLESCIRESDVVGEISDKLFGVILKNVSNEDVQTLLGRFKAQKIKAEQVSFPEMKELMKEAG